MMLTLEEQERRAYISGNTQLADALGAVMDAISAAKEDCIDCDEDADFEDLEDIETVLRYALAAPPRVEEVADLI